METFVGDEEFDDDDDLAEDKICEDDDDFDGEEFDDGIEVAALGDSKIGESGDGNI